MNTLKLLAFLRGYITYIFQVRVKHYLSAAIARFTQQLRKNVRLKKRYTSEIQNRIKAADSSNSLRLLFEDRSARRRTNVASSSGTLRLLFDCASTPTRSVVEALPKPSRRDAKPVSNMSRRNPKAEPKASRPGGEISSSKDFFLTNFAPIPAFHTVGLGFCFTVTRILSEGDPKPTRRKFEQRWEKGGNWSPIEQVLVEKLVVNPMPINRVKPKRSVLRCFKAICTSLILQLNTLLGLICPVVQRALKYLLFVADYKRAYRMILTCLFLCLVSMFSLSAQTPRKDSGADGLTDLIALKPGDKIPDAVWNQSLELNYFNGKKKTVKFADLKGKLILLDFWSTGCPSCIEGIPKMELIQQRFPNKMQVVMVNSKRNKDTAKRIKTRFEKFKADFNFTPSLPTVLDDTIFTALFAHNTLPALAVIDAKGEFVAMTSSHSLTDKNIQALMDGNAVLKNEGNYKNLIRSAAEPLLDTVGLHYISAFGGYREHYLPVYPNLNHKNGTTFLQMGNQSLQFMLFQAYGQALKGFRQNDLVIDTLLGRQFKEKLLNLNSTQNKYWYQFYTYDSVSRSQFADIFCREFQNYFKIAVARRSDSIELYKIRFSDKIKNILTSRKASIARFQGIGEEAFYQNIPIGLFLQNLFYAFDLPTELQEKENFNIDITIPAGFVRWTEQEKLTFLNERGIVFSAVKEYKTYPLVYPIY
ncbi:TlpA family protein disulfide reductase [Sphingobacterium sp. UBA3549]|nr:TlpA disulfide reductase family protein [Sphingobacterium sp. UBA3549]